MDFSKPKIMGIVNVTPDSFSDGGIFESPDDAEVIIGQMIKNKADIIDIGGESTGPGSKNVSLKEELKRVRPVIDFIKKNKLTKKTIFSIDTYKSEVAKCALENGFSIVNDVTALRGDPKMADVLLEFRPYVILMYSKDLTARTTRKEVDYDDVIKTISAFLKERTSFLMNAGFPKNKIIIDPGMGAFISSKPQYSFETINRLSDLKALGFPICIGVSRKSFLGGEIENRDPISAEWSLKAIKNGASIIRTHNVRLIIN